MTELRAELQRRHREISDNLNHPLIVSAYTAQQRAADMAHQFTQEASFFWLTGINEPDWRAVLDDGELILIAPKHDDVQQLFDGGISSEEALKLSGAARVVEHGDVAEYLGDLAKKYSKVYTLGKDPHSKYYHFEENSAPRALRKILAKLFPEVEDVRPILSRLRAIKSEYEIAQIQRAIDASIEGFLELKRQLLHGAKYEYELEATLNSAFRKTGAEGHAYDPIVAGGHHACTLHYAVNNGPLSKNNLVLIDAGAKVGGYAADITRTYVIDTATARQKEIHAAVQKAHSQIIELIKPGVGLKQYQGRVDEIMKAALAELGLLEDKNDNQTYRKYFPHAVGHGLGLDVHESLGGYAEFIPGMVLTVEPGIYIPEEGIGVRIEDVILVTENGNRNLSARLSTDL